MADNTNNGRQRTLGTFSLVSLGVGLTIGSGTVSLPGAAILMTGRSMWLAFAVAVIVGFVLLLPWMFCASTIRMKGGDYTMVQTLVGEKVSGIFIWNVLFQQFSISSLGIAGGQYLQSIFPNVDAKTAGLIIVTIFFVLNMFGIDFMSKLQNVMFFLLMAGLFTLIICGLAHLQPDTFAVSVRAEGYTGGTLGFFNAVIVLMYACTSHQCLPYFGDNAKDARRDIPKAMALTSLIILIVYTLLGIVAANVLPVEQVAGQPLTVVAREILPFPLFVFFMIAGPFAAIFTTLNSIFVAAALNVVASAEDGWFPKWFCYRNRYGMPVVCMLAIFVLTMIPQFIGLDIGAVVTQTMLLQYVLKFVNIYAVIRIPKVLPEFWEKSSMHLPNGVFYLIMGIIVVIQLGVIATSIASMTLTAVLVSAAILVICAIVPVIRYKMGLVHISTTKEDLY